MLLLIFALTLLSVNIIAAQTAWKKPPYISVKLYPDGWAGIMQVEPGDPDVGAMNVTLLTSKVTNIVVLADDGTPLNYHQNGRTLTVISLGSTSVNVSYYTDELTSKSGGTWIATINSTEPTLVTLPRDILLLQADPLPDDVMASNTTTMLSYNKGPVNIYYSVIVKPLPPKPSPTKTSALLPAIVINTRILLSISAVAIVIIIAGVAIVALRRSKRGRVELRPDDTRVLELVRKEGPLPESEISRRLTIPRTTTSRIVRRLERMGLIKVEKAGGINLVKAAGS